MLPGMKCVAVFDTWWNWKVTLHETRGSVWHVMKGYLAWNAWQCLTCDERLPGMKHVAVFDICHERLSGMKCVAVFDMWWKVTWHEMDGSVWHVMKGYLTWNVWQCCMWWKVTWHEPCGIVWHTWWKVTWYEPCGSVWHNYVMKGYLAWNMWQCLTYYVMKGYLAWNMWQHFTIWHTGIKHVAVFHYLTHVIKGYLALKSRQSSLWLIWWKFTWHWTHGQAHWSAAGTDDCSSTWIQTETKHNSFDTPWTLCSVLA